MKKIILIIGLLIGAAQIALPQWVSNYQGHSYGDDNSVSNSHGQAIASDNLDNAYVTGSTGEIESYENIFTIKYDSHGDTLWTRTYSGSGNFDSKGQDIAVDNDGNVYVTGFVSTIESNTDCIVLKYNTSGTLLWSRTYNGTGNNEDKAFGIGVDNAGSIYITGYATTARNGTDCLTIKYNSEGTQQWLALYNGTGNAEDKAFGIAVDNLNNIYITGYSVSSSNQRDIITIKYNSSGERVWDRAFDGPGHYNDEGSCITKDGSNNILVAGYVSTNSSDNTDCAVLKYSASGALLWSRTYNGEGTSEDKAFGIAADEVTGNVFITGCATGASNGMDYVTIGYNSQGTEQWVSLYNGTGNGNDMACAITLLNKFVIITGTSWGVNNNYDYATIRYKAKDGNQQQVSRYSMSRQTDDKAKDIVASIHNNVFVTGYSELHKSSQSQSVMSTLMIQPVESPEVNTLESTPYNYTLYQNYPNPFNPSTRIKFEITRPSNVKLTVRDFLGKEVAILQDGFMNPGEYEREFSGKSFASGVYFYELSAGEFRQVKKMTLIK